MTAKDAPELWEQLDHESSRAYEAFKIYLRMAPSERSVIRAWRAFSGNAEAKNPPGYFQRWVADFAWKERGRAHDAHLERIRRRGMEGAVEEEAKRQAEHAEKTRYHLQEMLVIGYERAMQKLEEVTPDEMRIQDVLGVIRLHIDVSKEFGHAEDPGAERGWDEEDDAHREAILKQFGGAADAEGLDEVGGEENEDE